MRYAALLAILLSLNVCALARAQLIDVAQPRTLTAQGTEVFRSILHYFGLRPVATLDDLKQHAPEETLIVVFGNTDFLKNISKRVGGLIPFSRSGGGILVATDRVTSPAFGLGSATEAGGLWEWRVHGKPVVDSVDCYRGKEACPLLASGLIRSHPLFEGISQGIATNRPSFLEGPTRGVPSGLGVLAKFGPGANFKQQPFMIGSTTVDRVLVLAGHGVFMNMMLAQADNDNITFAFNAVRWLSQAPEGKSRKYAFFMENRIIATEFDSGLTGAPPVPIPPTQVLNRLLGGLEDEDFFNRLVQANFTRNEILRGALMVGSLVVLLYGGWKLIGARQRSERVAALTVLSPPSDGDDGGVRGGQEVLSQRRSAMTQKGNFAEPAAGLVRSFFAEYATLTVKQTLPYSRPVRAFQANGGWLGRRRLLRQVDYLQRIEAGQAGIVSARQLKRLPAVLDAVAAAIQDGRLVVNSEG
jgi:hypothetical protein